MFKKKFSQTKEKDVPSKSELDQPKVIDKATMDKYSKGDGIQVQRLRQGNKKHLMKMKEMDFKKAQESTARTEILLTEPTGFLEADDLSYTSHVTQMEIKKAVDMTAATKSFDLQLDKWGPYKFRYSGSGRHMALAGRRGHLAAFDWVTKKLAFETNVEESIHDVCFLHTEQMVATAQKEFTYIYDHQGIELHCLKQFHRTCKLEFLPYHFLLCAGSEAGYLRWLDVTVGQEVLQYPTRKGRLNIMCQNPSNAVICCGHSNGTVSMWTPNEKEPVFSMLCHPYALRSIAVDNTGRLLATACNNRMVRLWDLRNLGKILSSYKLNGVAGQMAFSQKQLLALSFNNVVEVYRNCTVQDDCEVYMSHKDRATITGLQFCPFEDVLGCTTACGYSSLIVPGCGEPNFDAWEQNPFSGKSARREAEVKGLLEKIPADLITLDPQSISQVDTMTMEEKLDVRKELAWVKVPKYDVKPRYRMKGKSGSAQKFKRKAKVKEAEKRQYVKFIKDKKESMDEFKRKPVEKTEPEILDRFKAKR